MLARSSSRPSPQRPSFQIPAPPAIDEQRLCPYRAPAASWFLLRSLLFGGAVKRLDTPRNGQRIGICRSRSSFKLVGGHPRSGRTPDIAGPRCALLTAGSVIIRHLRGQPPRTEEPREPIDEGELRALAAARITLTWWRSTAFSSTSFPSGPNGVDREAGELASLPAWSQLRPQSLHASQDPSPGSRDARQAPQPSGSNPGSPVEPLVSLYSRWIPFRCAW